MRPCQWHSGRGIAKYAQLLIRHMVEARPDHTVAFLLSQALPVPASLTALLGLGRTVYEGADLTAAPAPTSIARRGPATFAIFYDAIPAIFPDRYLVHPRDRARYRRGVRMLRSCNRIFAISPTSREDAVHTRCVSRDRID